MWLACSGSLIPNILAGDDAGYDAAYGTVAHRVTEEWLKADKRPGHLIGKKQFIHSEPVVGYLITIDEEMLHYVEQSVERADWIPGNRFIELKVDFSQLTPIPNQKGTLDLAIEQPWRKRPRLYVTDHKYGSSPQNIVYAEENPQIMIYAIGFSQTFKRPFQEYVFQINQPILHHFDEWSCGRDGLTEFAAYVKERAAAAWRLDAPRTPGVKQCRFCAVRATCPANAKLQEDLMSSVFHDETIQTAEQMANFLDRLDDTADPFKLQLATVAELTTAQMARLLPYRKMADAWWAALDAELNRRAAEGAKIPGMKPVEARTKRAWLNRSAAEKLLLLSGLERDDFIQEKMVTPAEAERQLIKRGHKRAALPKLLSEVVHKPAGRVILVPESDPRTEVQDLGAFAFGDTEDSESSDDGDA